MVDKTRFYQPGTDENPVRVIGSRRQPLRDLYHALLRMSWVAVLSWLAALYMLVNALFGQAYFTVGGIAHAQRDSWVDAFCFSVQTFSTIGYGSMYPDSGAARALVVLEALSSFMLTALGTGLIFAKFSHPMARMMFTRNAVIGPVDGKRTLALRVGNERGNAIVDARFRAAVVRRELTLEGDVLYRTYDLKLVRERALALNRSFRVLHVIDESSPLFGLQASATEAQVYELQIIVVGFDDTVMQTVHARYTYYPRDIVWNARLADVLTLAADGSLTLDLHKFHDVELLASSQPALMGST
jgi:inward rectifier potassium channel